MMDLILDNEDKLVAHQGGCHCGAVRWELQVPQVIRASECNCSVCYKSGHLGVIVPRSRFRIIQGETNLHEYQFNSKVAHHYFCKTCEIKSFYIPRSHPEGVSVNARCIDKELIKDLVIKPFNGQEWEKQYPDGRGEYL
jgi:hypothetical protein